MVHCRIMQRCEWWCVLHYFPPLPMPPRCPGLDAAYSAALPATYAKFDAGAAQWLYHVPNELDWSCYSVWTARYLADTAAQGASAHHGHRYLHVWFEQDTRMYYVSRILVHIIFWDTFLFFVNKDTRMYEINKILTCN